MTSFNDLGSRKNAYVALTAVCLLWGTTYLAIRISLEGLPPLCLIAFRYIISGSILLFAARIGGAHLPHGRELIGTAVCGIICIGVGNSFLAFAEEWIPSGLAALFFTTCPFWMVGLDALLPGGKRPLASTLGGLLLGAAGVFYLVLPSAIHEGIGGRTFIGFLFLQISAVGWAAGSLLQKRVETRAHPFVSGAVQQLAAGLALFLPAVCFEKVPSSLAFRPALAVAYLIVFGSIVGFSSFIYCMARLPVAVVSIYTFVNPVVAVFLGWLFFREPCGHREFIAMAIVFSGIGWVKWSESGRRAGLLKSAPAPEAGAVGR